ncbi:MAG: methyltransferase family protein [Kiritimatiellia bacterium]
MDMETLNRPRSTTSRCAARLFHGITILAFAALLAPLAWLVYAPSFPGRLAGVLVFTAFWCERMWSTYLRLGRRHVSAEEGRDWSALAVGYVFALVMGGAIVEFLLRRNGWGHGGHVAAGTAVYAASLGLRYWAFAVLGRQWRIDVSDPGHERQLIRTGPYRFVRHPIYVAACLEVVGLPWLLGAWFALAMGLFVFVPLEVARARYEERFLRRVFGAAYDRFAEEVPGFLPLGSCRRLVEKN